MCWLSSWWIVFLGVGLAIYLSLNFVLYNWDKLMTKPEVLNIISFVYGSPLGFFVLADPNLFCFCGFFLSFMREMSLAWKFMKRCCSYLCVRGFNWRIWRIFFRGAFSLRSGLLSSNVRLMIQKNLALFQGLSTSDLTLPTFLQWGKNRHQFIVNFWIWAR